MSEDLKSSAHVWGDGNESSPASQSTPTPNLIDAQDSDEPPSYTNATATSSTSPRNEGGGTRSRTQRPSTPPRPRLNPIESLSLLSSIPFHSYSLPNSTITPDRTVTTTTYAPFYSSPSSLAKLLSEQAAIPPRPLLRIRGSHADNAGRPVQDFDVVVNLTTLLEMNHPKPQPSTHPSSSSSHTNPRLSFKQLPLPTSNTTSASSTSNPTSSRNPLSRLSLREKRPHPTPTPLDQWTQKFTSDKSEHKSFHLTRVIPHLSTLQTSLEGSIRTMLASLQYRGKIEVSFPVQYEGLVVLKKPGNWLVSVLNFYPEKRYDGVVEARFGLRGAPDVVVSVDGPGVGGGEEGGHGSGVEIGTGAGAGLEYVKRADANARSLAEEFWRDWSPVVRNAVLLGRKGRVGVEEWIEVQMGRREKDRGRDWGVDGSWEAGPNTWGTKWGGEGDDL